MFQKYFELGLSVIPVFRKGKSPIIQGWQRYCHELPTQEQVEQWDNESHNIGVACGPASGIVVLDIDSDDEKLLSMCPPSPIRRRGKKGECRFFKYSSNVQSQSFPLIDILSVGRQVLVPPSIHPDTGKPYVWITPDTLENFPVNDLPELDLSFLDKLVKTNSNIITSVEGRNNKLVDIISSMRGRGEAEQDIINEVYNWDKNFHSPRLFLDKTEGYKGTSEDDAKRNAWRLVSKVTMSLINNGVAVIADSSPVVILDESKPAPLLYQEKEFPPANGILKDIVGIINNYSERNMPNIALGGAIALMAAICSNRVRFDGTWPNLYVLNLAPTGAGKSFPQNIVKRILGADLENNLIGFGNYRSSSAISRNLVSRRERLDIIDEISTLFAQMKSGGIYQTEMLEELCKLWSESNGLYVAGQYAEKEDTSTCYNPCVNILGSSTIAGIKESVNKLMVTKGLMPRVLIFSHEHYGHTKESYLDFASLSNVILKIKEFMEKFPKKESESAVDKLKGPMYEPHNMTPIDEAALSYFKSLRAEIESKKETEKSETMVSFLTRFKENVMKLATISAASSLKDRIELSDLKWAKEVVEVSMHNSNFLIEETSAENANEKDIIQVLNTIKRNGEITSGVLQNRYRKFTPIRLKQILQQLMDDGSICLYEKKTSTNKLVRYYSASDL